MYRILIGEDRETITFIFDGVETVTSVSAIKASRDWIDSKLVKILHSDPRDPGFTKSTTVYRDAFTSKILHNELREIVENYAYEYNKDIHKLYILLDGRDPKDGDAEIGNLLAQRDILDKQMSAYKNDKVVRQFEVEKKLKQKLRHIDTMLANSDKLTDEDREKLEDLKRATEVHEQEIETINKEPKPFLVSTEIKKMIMVSLDPTAPEINLANVTPEKAQAEINKRRS